MDAAGGMSRNSQALVHPTSLAGRPQLSTTSPSESIQRRARATFHSFTSSPGLLSHPSAENDTQFSRVSDLMAMYLYSIWFLPWEKVTYSRSNTAELTKEPPNRSAMDMALFTRYLRRVLETTSTPPNNVYLAILYIYRLKKANPTLIGKPGSEYRIAVMALLLAHRCEFRSPFRRSSEISAPWFPILLTSLQIWMTFTTLLARGLRYPDSPPKRFMSWTSNS
ncbi:hypothetical protein F5883DRAFT_142783 [Diaporthe sp. PMI_573]|nr:hypothetical protein F5883DRAFT_142783 [Diaporthaceae sp. PMI_573]